MVTRVSLARVGFVLNSAAITDKGTAEFERGHFDARLQGKY
jgi:hypothetical protein